MNPVRKENTEVTAPPRVSVRMEESVILLLEIVSADLAGRVQCVPIPVQLGPLVSTVGRDASVTMEPAVILVMESVDVSPATKDPSVMSSALSGHTGKIAK